MQEQDGPGGPNWFSAVEPARMVQDAGEIAWDDSADLIVVGYGGAGVAAALEAAERGGSVIAVDRYHGGGATAMNGGVYYAGGGTPAQIEAGVSDTPEEMFKYLHKEVAGVVSDATLRRFCEESVANMAWMMRHGVQFNSRLYRGKTSYPTADYYLYHSDSSLAASYRAIARPAARGHRAFVPATGAAVGYGVGLYNPLRDAAARLGVRLFTKCEARQIILGPGGQVLGIKLLRIPPGSKEAVEHDQLESKGMKLLLAFPPAFPGASLFIRRAERMLARARAIEERARRPVYLRARAGVCLSAGGFIFNRDMVQHYAPKYAAGMPLGSPGDDGSGIRLGQSAGGAVARMNHISAWRFINPPAAWARGMIVNAAGQRYVDETLYGASIGLPMVEDHGGVAWLVLDRALWQQAWHQLRTERLMSFQKYPAMLAMLFSAKKGATPAALAAKCGVDPAGLAASIAAYSDLARGVCADPFGKGRDDAAAFGEGPYYAIDMSITAPLSPLPTLTLGGLRVDEATGEVVGPTGQAIPGLYAAGRTAIGICSNIYVSGLSAADCTFSGRRAGAHAALRAANTAQPGG